MLLNMMNRVSRSRSHLDIRFNIGWIGILFNKQCEGGVNPVRELRPKVYPAGRQAPASSMAFSNGVN